MEIILGDNRRYPGTVAGLLQALTDAEAKLKDRFVIVERAGQYYMQCLAVSPGWLLEKREGDEEHHFRGRRIDESKREPQWRSLFDRIMSRGEKIKFYLTRDEIEEVMIAYISESAEPEWLDWENIEV